MIEIPILSLVFNQFALIAVGYALATQFRKVRNKSDKTNQNGSKN